MKRFLSAFSIIFLMATGSAFAGGPPPMTYDLVTGTASDDTETRAFGGLSWRFGDAAPEAVLGAFHTTVEANGDTTGAKAYVQIGFWDGIKISRIKAQYLHGNEDAQAAGGLGYDFGTQQPILVLGGNFPYVAAGVDVAFMNGFGITPFVMGHSQDEFENSKTPPVTCELAEGDTGEFNNSDCTPPMP